MMVPIDDDHFFRMSATKRSIPAGPQRPGLERDGPAAGDDGGGSAVAAAGVRGSDYYLDREKQRTLATQASGHCAADASRDRGMGAV